MSGLCNAQFERPFIDVFSCFMVGKLWSLFEGFIRQDMKEQVTCTVLTVFAVNNTAEVYLSSSRSNSIVCNSDEGDIMYVYRIQTVIC